MKTPEIKTTRLVLRAVRIEDAPDIYGYVKNPSVLRYTTGTPPREFEETEAFVRGLAAQSDDRFAWAVQLTGRSCVIGVVELGLKEKRVTGSVDYALSEVFWNQGIMTEAVRAILVWAFTAVPELETVSSAAMTANPASTRLQQKCGMRLVRHENAKWAKFIQPVELAVCEITREEWRAIYQY
jgi:ribosomal-protein-alanine N-acetyltransferase